MDGPKFNLVETIFGAAVALAIDIISFFADFLFGVGGFIVQTLTWLLFTLWFTLKGVKATATLVRRFLVPIAVQLVPFIPTQVFTFLATVYMENHPERFAALQKASAVTSVNVKNIKNIKEAKGTVAAAKAAYGEYQEVRKAA